MYVFPSQKDAVVKNLALVEVAMGELCRNALRCFMLNPSAADAALNNTTGRLRSLAADEIIKELKVSGIAGQILFVSIQNC